MHFKTIQCRVAHALILCAGLSLAPTLCNAQTAAPYRNTARHVSFTPPGDWKEIYSDNNTVEYTDGNAAYIVYFGGFSDLFYVVGASGSPWNLHLDGHDHFTATAGSFFMEARGDGSYTTILVAPSLDLPRSYPMYKAMDARVKFDAPPSRGWWYGSSSTGKSSSASNTGGCPGCANMLVNHMNAMTGITAGGW